LVSLYSLYPSFLVAADASDTPANEKQRAAAEAIAREVYLFMCIFQSSFAVDCNCNIARTLLNIYVSTVTKYTFRTIGSGAINEDFPYKGLPIGKMLLQVGFIRNQLVSNGRQRANPVA
jgi:hypothetical protein